VCPDALDRHWRDYHCSRSDRNPFEKLSADKVEGDQNADGA
jgi:hypothetical protein